MPRRTRILLGVGFAVVATALLLGPASVSFPVHWGDQTGANYEDTVTATCGPALTATMTGLGINPVARAPATLKRSPWLFEAEAAQLCREHVWRRTVWGVALLMAGVTLLLLRSTMRRKERLVPTVVDPTT